VRCDLRQSGDIIPHPSPSPAQRSCRSVSRIAAVQRRLSRTSRTATIFRSGASNVRRVGIIHHRSPNRLPEISDCVGFLRPRLPGVSVAVPPSFSDNARCLSTLRNLLTSLPPQASPTDCCLPVRREKINSSCFPRLSDETPIAAVSVQTSFISVFNSHIYPAARCHFAAKDCDLNQQRPISE
jgi:hypothetical protein